MALREFYERAPDGAQWPPNLKGLSDALDDIVITSMSNPETVYTLSVIVNGHARAIRTYKDGELL